MVGRTLVEERLAACVNIVPRLRSIYAWRGKVEDEAEVLCLVKTRPELWEALRARIGALHPYEVPEIVALRADQVSPPYLAWLRGETRDP